MIDPSERAPTRLLIAFIDFTRFSFQARCLEDEVTARVLDETYERIGGAAARAGGRVVKFMGDAALLVFPEADVDGSVLELLALKDALDAFMAASGWVCRASIKAHFGAPIAGPYGVAGDKRFDVIGNDVNVAAMIEGGGGVALSAEAFRKLGPELRKRFKKHTPPIAYIRIEDPRPFRPRRG
jgi:class 3 adenylate cyclase